MKFISRLAIAIIILACGLFIFLQLVFENKPNLTDSTIVSVEDASNAKLLGVKIRNSLLSNKVGTSLTVSENEMNSCFRLMSRGLPELRGRVGFSEKEIDVGISYHFSKNIFGKYLNARLVITPSASGLNVSCLTLGKINIPGPTALFLGRHLVDLAIGEKTGSAVISAVTGIEANQKVATIRFVPIQGLKEHLERIQRRFQYVHGVTTPNSDPALVRTYYKLLMSVDKSVSTARPVSLTQFIEPLFAAAKAKGGNPAEQNKAALLALSIFLGSDHIKSFIAPFKTGDMASYRRRNHLVVLRKRHDLVLHFLISAGLEVLAEDNITNVIGEFKELHDSLPGGSGFSFIDLAADRAGVHLAKAATNPISAKRVQVLLSEHLAENAFFPDVSGLPEGITDLDFGYYYSNLDSSEYQALVYRIDRCIEHLPIHQSPDGEKSPESASEPCVFTDIVPEKLQ